MTLIVDTRENKWIVQKIMECVPDARLETLSYGDYIVEGASQRFIIERKTIPDLFKSLNDGRFYEQMKGIERHDGYKKLILIEGDFWDAQRWDKGLSIARFTGTKVSLIYGWQGISWVTTENQNETVEFLRRLNEKVGSGVPESMPRPIGIAKDGRTPNEEVVDGVRWVEGIGEAKATELLLKFRTVSNVSRASFKELVTVLGEKDAERVFEAFRRKFRAKKEVKANAKSGAKQRLRRTVEGQNRMELRDSAARRQIREVAGERISDENSGGRINENETIRDGS